MRKKKQKEAKSKEFVVMNSKLEYFAGMMYGGQLVWCSDFKEAKPLNDEAKFKTLERIAEEDLLMDYI